MKVLKSHPLVMVCLALCICVAAVIAFTAVYAYAASDTIQGCYNNTNGALRRVNSDADCRNHETPISWNVMGPAGPAGPPGPPGAPGPGNVEAFRHTHTVENECNASAGPTFSVVDHPSLNGNANALVFVTALIGINGTGTGPNPNSNLLVVYTGGSTFGTCPAGRWVIGGGDVTTGAQFNVMVVEP